MIYRKGLRREESPQNSPVMAYSNQQGVYGQGYPSGPEQRLGQGAGAQQVPAQGGGELAAAMAKVTITDQYTGQAYTQAGYGNGTQQTMQQGVYYGAAIQHQPGGYSQPQSQSQQMPTQPVSSGPLPTVAPAGPYLPTSQVYGVSSPSNQAQISGVFNNFTVAGSLSVSHSTQPGVHASAASGSYAEAPSSTPATHHQGAGNAHMSPVAQNSVYQTFAPPPNQQGGVPNPYGQPQYPGPPQQTFGEHSHTVNVSAAKPTAPSKKQGLFGKLSVGQKIAMGAAGDIASAVLTKERKDYLRDKLEHQMSRLDISGANPIQKLTGTAASHATPNSQASTGTQQRVEPHTPSQGHNVQRPATQTQHIAVAYATQQTAAQPHPTARAPTGPAPTTSRPAPANRPPMGTRPAGAPPPPRPGPAGGPRPLGPPMMAGPMVLPAGGGAQPPSNRETCEGQERGYAAGGDTSNGGYGEFASSRQVYDESSDSYGTYNDNSNATGGSNERGGFAYGDSSGSVDGLGGGEGSWATQDQPTTVNTVGLPPAENATLADDNTNSTSAEDSTNISNSATVEGNIYVDMSVTTYTESGMGNAVPSGAGEQATGGTYQEYDSGVATDMGTQAYGGGPVEMNPTGDMGTYQQAYGGTETVSIQGAYTETTTLSAQGDYTGVPTTATQDSYTSQGMYSGQDTVPSQGTCGTQGMHTGSDSYQDQGIYSEQPTYPNQVAYPSDGTYAQQDYSSQGTLPAQDTYGADGGYTDTNSYLGADPYTGTQDYGGGQVESYQQADPYAATEAYPEPEVPYESYDYSEDYGSSIADAFAIQDSGLF